MQNSTNTVCMVQGPFSPLYTELSKELKKSGVEVVRILFCAGDRLYSREDDTSLIIDFKGLPCDWPEFIGDVFKTYNVTTVIGHGDCHFYNEEAFNVAKSQGVNVLVSEEGYLRPHYITLEENGVNAKSPLMDLVDLRDLEVTPQSNKVPAEIAATFFERSMWCASYYLQNWLLKDDYPFYAHRRQASIFSEVGAWLKTGVITLRTKGKCKKVVEDLVATSATFYLVPLQVECDSQIVKHSKYENIQYFISEVMKSFSNNSDHNSKLVFKHHPYCLGFSDYTDVIEYFCEKYNLVDRVLYLKGGHLPTLLKNAKGVVTVNSTVGLSSLHHLVPTYVAGDAFLNRTELTHQGEMDTFWQTKKRPEKWAVKALFSRIHSDSLLNASLYSNFEYSSKVIAARILTISS